MTSVLPPKDPLIFHITHLDNLPSILSEGGLWSDAKRIERSVANTNIGHLHIKKRRLTRGVHTAGGGMLGEYVPFNFCPRSVMLYVVHRGHQDYGGGQENILHLVSCVSRASTLNRAWAFTDRHAELAHALYFDQLDRLSEVRWDVMDRGMWTDVKEERQAEFLVKEFFPWEAITEIGVQTKAMAARVQTILSGRPHVPAVSIHPQWYY